MFDTSKLDNNCKAAIAVSDLIWTIDDSNVNQILDSVVDAISNKIFSVDNVLKMIEHVFIFQKRNSKNVFEFIKAFLTHYQIQPCKTTFNNELLQVLLVKSEMMSLFVPFKYRKMTLEQTFKAFPEGTVNYAILWDDLEMLQSLCEVDGFNFDQNFDFSTSILDYAAEAGSAKTFKYLASKGANLSTHTLQKAFYGNNQEIISECLKSIEIDQLCIENAVSAHHNETVNTLFTKYNLDYSWCSTMKYFNLRCFFFKAERTDDINKFDFEGYNAILAAAQYVNYVAMDYLLKHGAHIESMDTMGNTPLMFASIGGMKEMVELLIQNNANKDVKDIFGKDAITVAALQENRDIVHYLFEQGANGENPQNEQQA